MSTDETMPSLLSLIRAFEISIDRFEAADAEKALAPVIQEEDQRRHVLQAIRRVLRRSDEERLLTGFVHGTEMVDFDVST
ncbi:MAG TPA: hypothetical protein VJ875_27010 [Pyrinomonadaceae bacterium]|nr:hypothetical protein [Pyrinomonadaceae bacterium]